MRVIASIEIFIKRITFVGIEYRPQTDPLQEVLEFVQMYEEKYGCEHPVFYQGTFSQVLLTI